jgi:protein-S-isoprenylcysteine O-methyltransferase Ste14
MATLRNVAVSALFTIFGGPAIVVVLIPWLITHFHIPAREPLAQMIGAAALIASGLAPLLESIVRFIDVGRGTLVPVLPPEHLVVSGLYRYVRNPMYIGVLIAISGETLLFWNRNLLIHLAVVAFLIHLFVCLYEEPTLTRMFPEEYPLYQCHVRRWLPRLMPWKNSPETETN